MKVNFARISFIYEVRVNIVSPTSELSFVDFGFAVAGTN